MYEDNIFREQAWERHGAAAVGLTLSMFRFMVSFFASVAVGAGFRFIPTVQGRHLYAVVTGLVLIYYPFGNGIFNAFVPAAVTYVLMRAARPHCHWLSWAVNFSYLVYCHVASASGAAWKEGNMDFTGCQMIVTLKLISAAVSYHDGMRKEQELSAYQRSHKLEAVPGVLEWLSYVFAAGNLLAGPTFELSDYLLYINRQGQWDPKASRPMPSPVQPGLFRIGKALACMVIHLTLVAKFPVDYLESDSYAALPLLKKIAVIYLIGFVYRFKYYFAWIVSEAALVLSGFSFAGWGDDGRPCWDAFSNARILRVEFCTSFAELPVHWNTCTGNFLRHYVYERLAPKGRRPPFHVLLITQLVSAVWHGLFPGYLMFFTSIAFAVEASKLIFRYERALGGKWGRFPPWVLFKWALTAFVLNYSASSFLLIELRPGLRVWRSVYFLGHVLMLAVMAAGTAFPPPNKKKAAPSTGSTANHAAKVQDGGHAAPNSTPAAVHLTRIHETKKGS